MATAKKARAVVKKPTIGWREWAALPNLGVPAIKVKIDTGARTSALHAANVRYFELSGQSYVEFEVHPEQKSARGKRICRARVMEQRSVKDSHGNKTRRPVILTTVQLGEKSFLIEVTLVARDQMEYRMLLGRQAVAGRFVIDPQKSFLRGR